MVSSQQRGRGEHKWDNEEIKGHRNAVALCAHSLEKLLPDQHIGKLLKSYHMKNPRDVANPDTSTTHPKLEVQYSKKYSDTEMQNVPWSSAEEYDLTDLQRELDEFLVNALDWAGITTRADERVYVADEYWDGEETERELTIYENPIEDIVQYERDLAVHHMTSAELTTGERRVLETIVDGGRELHYDEIAERSDTSKSTVYRAAKKLSDEIEIHGGEFDRYEMSKILRNGHRAACAVGSKTAARFTDATFAWFDTTGDRVVRESAFVYHGTALKELGWKVWPPP